jgi:gluconokinase
MSQATPSPRFVLVIGVSGSGKTTVGRAVAARLGWDFYEADDVHPAENVAKMAAGIPLSDADRLPWLQALHTLIAASLERGRPGVMACSALKERYRRILLEGTTGVAIVFLKGDYELFYSRMATRTGHYMGPGMLRSQFADLEEPKRALVIDAALPVDEIVEQIVDAARS